MTTPNPTSLDLTLPADANITKESLTTLATNIIAKYDGTTLKTQFYSGDESGKSLLTGLALQIAHWQLKFATASAPASASLTYRTKHRLLNACGKKLNKYCRGADRLSDYSTEEMCQKAEKVFLGGSALVSPHFEVPEVEWL